MEDKVRGFKPVDITHLKSYKTAKDVIMPLCKTERSAGYDFFAPYNFMVGPGETVIIWSDVKVYMQPYEVLNLFIRSSVGIKKGVVLANGVGVVDSDYYNNKSTDGNIGMSLRNTTDSLVEFKKGEGLMQGIFYEFLKSDNCNCTETRKGGMGSTNEG